MAPPLASVDALSVWIGENAEPMRAVAILNAASTLIRTRTGRVWVDDDGPEDGVTDLQVAALESVCLSVAARVYQNPRGLTQKSTGPFSWSVAAWSALGLALSPEEAAQLPGGQPGSVNGLSSVRVQAPWGARGSDPRGGISL